MEAQGGTAPAAPEGGEGGGGIDFSPVMGQLEQLGSRLDGFQAQLEQFGQPEDEVEQDAPGEFDLPDFDFAPDQGLDPQQAQQYLNSLIDQRVSSGVDPRLEEALGPIAAQVEQMRVERDAESLIEEFPQLADPQVAETTVQRAHELVAELGLDPSLANNRNVVALVFKANLADQYAAGEVPVGELQQPGLEAGAGAAPGGDSGPSLQEQIVAARSGGLPWR